MISGMNRRMFMKASMAFATLSGMSGLSTLFSQAAWAEDGIADGSAKRFDFDVL
ncbi:Glucans biosynthesis protein D [Erwinia piriflorinigrans CFBP 5888]|uniref:Glucans biosynthesis protein D n=1 Tax=Erwinia piriflorinigrans CFBP 5888 TaxID=1161919 RepID=V5ZA32_9GAMM|nr:Glucans biosynthesis protein D [Erwinia piriflorinigrans CFBP 5888]